MQSTFFSFIFFSLFLRRAWRQSFPAWTIEPWLLWVWSETYLSCSLLQIHNTAALRKRKKAKKRPPRYNSGLCHPAGWYTLNKTVNVWAMKPNPFWLLQAWPNLLKCLAECVYVWEEKRKGEGKWKQVWELFVLQYIYIT